MLLYIIETIDKKAVKIGTASKPDFRLRGFQTTSPLRLAAKYPCESYKFAIVLEREIRKALVPYRLCMWWYALSAAEAIQIIKTAEISISYVKRANWLDRYLAERNQKDGNLAEIVF